MNIYRGCAALGFFWVFFLAGYHTPAWAVDFAFGLLLVAGSAAIFVFAGAK